MNPFEARSLIEQVLGMPSTHVAEPFLRARAREFDGTYFTVITQLIEAENQSQSESWGNSFEDRMAYAMAHVGQPAQPSHRQLALQWLGQASLILQQQAAASGPTGPVMGPALGNFLPHGPLGVATALSGQEIGEAVGAMVGEKLRELFLTTISNLQSPSPRAGTASRPPLLSPAVSASKTPPASPPPLPAPVPPPLPAAAGSAPKPPPSPAPTPGGLVDQVLKTVTTTGKMGAGVLQQLLSAIKDPGQLDAALKQLKDMGADQVGSGQPLKASDFYREGSGKFELLWPLSPELPLPVPFDQLDRRLQFDVLFSEWTRRELEGNVALNEGRLGMAAEIFQECLRRAEQLNVKELEARSHEGLVRVAQRRGDRTAEALHLSQAAEARAAAGTPAGGPMQPAYVANVRAKAMIDFEEGRFREAEGELDRLIQRLGQPSTPQLKYELCQCLQSRSTIRRFANRHADALADLNLCEALVPEVAAVARSGLLASLYHARAKLFAAPHSALCDLPAASAELDKLRPVAFASWVVDDLEGDIASQRRDWPRALRCAVAASEALTKEGWHRGAASSDLRAGQAALELRDLTSAEKYLTRALDFFGRLGPPDQLSAAQLALARLRQAQGQTDMAWDLALQALAGAESLIRQFRSLADQQRFIADKLRFYDTAFDIGWAKGGDAGIRRAWSVAERAKSYYLCQLVANADVPLFDGVPKEDLERLKRLEAELDECEQKLGRLAIPDREGEVGRQTTERMRALSEERTQLLSALMHHNPRWATLRTPAPFELESALASLPSGWQVVSFYWRRAERQDGATLHLFYCDLERHPQCATITWAQADLEELRACREKLTTRSLGDLMSSACSEPLIPGELANQILPSEVRARFGNQARLLISPHGDLQGLPLHGMELGEEDWLIQCWPVQYIPTLALLPLRRAPVDSDAVLLMGCAENGFGDPLLKEVPEEIESLRQVWSIRIGQRVVPALLAADSSPDQRGWPLKRWSEFGHLHFACHGHFPPDRPLDAALRLGSSAVRTTELFAVQLHARLVSLSACSLGRVAGRLGEAKVAGDEWIGLCLPLFYAGAKSLVTSLWEADSATALSFMHELHQALSMGSPPAIAFQKAMLAVSAAPSPLWANWCLAGLPD